MCTSKFTDTINTIIITHKKFFCKTFAQEKSPNLRALGAIDCNSAPKDYGANFKMDGEF